jgi:hypothetical protein
MLVARSHENLALSAAHLLPSSPDSSLRMRRRRSGEQAIVVIAIIVIAIIVITIIGNVARV